MSQILFAELARRFESLQTELEQAHGAVLRGLIIMQMRTTLDAMWAEHRSSGRPSRLDLEEKERLLEAG